MNYLYLNVVDYLNFKYKCDDEVLDSDCSDSGNIFPDLLRREPCQIYYLPTVPRSCIEAQTVREEFAEYFVSEQGKLHFQYYK